MRLAIISIIAVGCLQGAVAGEIYCNAQGRDCGDRPGPLRTFVRSTAVTSGGAAATPLATAMASADGATDKVQAQRDKEKLVNKAQQQLNKDLTDKRGEQCKTAQAYYKSAVDATVLYRNGKDGKREDLSDAEAAQARLSAKLAMDRSCAQAGGN
jgi:hypothetical protein